MVDKSEANRDMERLIALAVKYFGVDTPILAVRDEGSHMIFTQLGGKELRCKFHDLMNGKPKVQPKATTEATEAAPKAAPKSSKKAGA
jgi:hypothetical protein